jgi:transaldolase
MTCKIYCDVASLDLIKKYRSKKIISGFTTNPSLMRQAGAKNYENYSKKIIKICKNKPVSLEVFADDTQTMIEQGFKINKWGKNVYVKVPIVNSNNKFTGKVISELSNNGIKLNITAVYSSKQTEKILKVINKNSKVIISIFVGRAGDAGHDPMPEILKSVKLAKRFKNVKILWASVREPYNFTQSKKLGCDIITVPPSIIDKIEKFGKSLDRLTQETVAQFLMDSVKSKFKI